MYLQVQHTDGQTSRHSVDTLTVVTLTDSKTGAARSFSLDAVDAVDLRFDELPEAEAVEAEPIGEAAPSEDELPETDPAQAQSEPGGDPYAEPVAALLERAAATIADETKTADEKRASLADDQATIAEVLVDASDSPSLLAAAEQLEQLAASIAESEPDA